MKTAVAPVAVSFLLFARVLCGCMAASAGEPVEPPEHIRQVVSKATYDETIGDIFGGVFKRGTDIEKPEPVEFKGWIPRNYTFAATDCSAIAGAYLAGPTAYTAAHCEGSIMSTDFDPDDPPSGVQIALRSSVKINFDVALYALPEAPAVPYVPLLFDSAWAVEVQTNMPDHNDGGWARGLVSISVTYDGDIERTWMYGDEATDASDNDFCKDNFEFVIMPWTGHWSSYPPELQYSLISVEQYAESTAIGRATPASGIENWSLAIAHIDPIIEIDPSWEHADKFALYFSPGIVPVPEPSTLVLLTIGALGITVGWWRRRRAA